MSTRILSGPFSCQRAAFPSRRSAAVRSAAFPAMVSALLVCRALLLPASVRAATPEAAALPSPPCAPARPVPPAPRPGTPAAVLAAFDSLLGAGRTEQARALCVGDMRRLFDFLAEAQARIAPLIDSCRSHEETLEEKTSGDWAYVNSRGTTVFRRPFMGQDSLVSAQAAHLFRESGGWRIAAIEELSDADAPVALRRGAPPDPAQGAVKPESVFPVSPMAPAEPGMADRLRLDARLLDGGSWEGFLPLGPGQKKVAARSPSDWTLEIRKVVPGSRPAAIGGGREQGSGGGSEDRDAARWLEGNSFLVLSDTLLRSTAATIAPGESDPARIAAAVYAWVSGHFDFRLGATLFGTSAEALRGLRGDCSEAAVLTAALLRARGVPSRIALGFASVGRGVFIGHAWCEARLGGAWVGVDAALREFPAGVERLKLAELDGRDDLRIAATNLMLRALGNVELRIRGAWKGGRPLALARYAGNAAEADRFFRDILDGGARAP